MPEISRFLGIVITMYWEYNTRHHKPHFHARYNEYECVFSIPEIDVLEGELPKRAAFHVKEWATEHIDELMMNWNNVKNELPLNKIKPLE